MSTISTMRKLWLALDDDGYPYSGYTREAAREVRQEVFRVAYHIHLGEKLRAEGAARETEAILEYFLNALSEVAKKYNATITVPEGFAVELNLTEAS